MKTIGKCFQEGQYTLPGPPRNLKVWKTFSKILDYWNKIQVIWLKTSVSFTSLGTPDRCKLSSCIMGSTYQKSNVCGGLQNNMETAWRQVKLWQVSHILHYNLIYNKVYIIFLQHTYSPFSHLFQGRAKDGRWGDNSYSEKSYSISDVWACREGWKHEWNLCIIRANHLHCCR